MHQERGDVPMKNSWNITTVTLWANRAVGCIIGGLLFAMPSLLDWYSHYRLLTSREYTAILAAFYCCAVVIGLALWNMDGLLRAIRKGQVFIRENVRRIRVVQWCCGGTGLICLPAAFCYYPLMFVVIIMGFLFLVVSVVCRVMDAAVGIREENDLTI